MKTYKIPAGTDNCLEYLLSIGADVERQCLQGYCGSCRMTLQSGEISYNPEPLAWLDPGVFTPCCATARTELLVSNI
jgi:ferredoxin